MTPRRETVFKNKGFHRKKDAKEISSKFYLKILHNFQQFTSFYENKFKILLL